VPLSQLSSNNKIVFFDGVCNLCNGSVDFLIRKDNRRILKYSPLQGKEIKKHNVSLNQEDLNTLYYYDGQHLLEKSAAWTELLKVIGGPWKAIGILCSLLPKTLLDWLYDRVATSRYAIFGKRETCRLPTPEERELFLD